MPKGTYGPERRLAIRLGRLRKSMPDAAFAEFIEADGALKWCPKCRQLLPVSAFQKCASKFDGLQGMCRSCISAANVDWWQRASQDEEYRTRTNERHDAWDKANPEKRRRITKAHNLKAFYGLTLEQFYAMVAERRGRCDICKKPFKNQKDTHVDHDHACCPGWKSCGKCVRGLLCSSCNISLGGFRDSPAVLRRAARYIEGHRSQGNVAAPVFGQGLLWDDSDVA